MDSRRLSKDAEEGRLFTDWWYVAEQRWFPCSAFVCVYGSMDSLIKKSEGVITETPLQTVFIQLINYMEVS